MVYLTVLFVANEPYFVDTCLGAIDIFAALPIAHDEFANDALRYFGGFAVKDACGEGSPFFIPGLVFAISFADCGFFFLGHLQFAVKLDMDLIGHSIDLDN